MTNSVMAMDRLHMRPSMQGSRHPAVGKYAGYAPRIIGFAILVAAMLFIAIGLATARI